MKKYTVTIYTESQEVQQLLDNVKRGRKGQEVEKALRLYASSFAGVKEVELDELPETLRDIVLQETYHRPVRLLQEAEGYRVVFSDRESYLLCEDGETREYAYA